MKNERPKVETGKAVLGSIGRLEFKEVTRAWRPHERITSPTRKRKSRRGKFALTFFASSLILSASVAFLRLSETPRVGRPVVPEAAEPRDLFDPTRQVASEMQPQPVQSPLAWQGRPSVTMPTAPNPLEMLGLGGRRQKSDPWNPNRLGPIR